MNDSTEIHNPVSVPLARLEIKHLRAFEAIYSTRNISRAGEALRMSQPTMSNLLSQLREVFDDQLFLRQARGVEPTSRADELIISVRRALREFQTVTQPTSAFDPTSSTREFRLHALDVFETSILPDLVSRFPMRQQWSCSAPTTSSD